MMFKPEPLDPATWPQIHALLLPAIEHGGDTTTHELIDQLLSGHAQLWVKREDGDPIAVAVTTLHTDRTVHCQLLGGKGLAMWMDELIAAVAKVARPVGVVAFTINGRVGWERLLGARGWRKKAVVMELTLGNDDGQ